MSEENVRVERVSLIRRGREFQLIQEEKERVKKERIKKAESSNVELPELGELVEILWTEDDGEEWWYVAVVIKRCVLKQQFTAYFPEENNQMDIYTEASTNKAAGQTTWRSASFQGGTYVAREEGIDLADICAEGNWDAEVFVGLNQMRLKGFNANVRLKKNTVILTPEYPSITPYV